MDARIVSSDPKLTLEIILGVFVAVVVFLRPHMHRGIQTQLFDSSCGQNVDFQRKITQRVPHQFERMRASINRNVCQQRDAKEFGVVAALTSAGEAQVSQKGRRTRPEVSITRT